MFYCKLDELNSPAALITGILLSFCLILPVLFCVFASDFNINCIRHKDQRFRNTSGDMNTCIEDLLIVFI